MANPTTPCTNAGSAEKLQKIPGCNSTRAEQIWDRIQMHPGIIGIILLNSEGIQIRSTLDNSTTTHYCALIKPLTDCCLDVVRDINPTDNIQTVRLVTTTQEIMIAPEKNYYLIVIQQRTLPAFDQVEEIIDI